MQASFIVVILKVLASTRVKIITASITIVKKAPNHLGVTYVLVKSDHIIRITRPMIQHEIGI